MNHRARFLYERMGYQISELTLYKIIPSTFSPHSNLNLRFCRQEGETKQKDLSIKGESFWIFDSLHQKIGSIVLGVQYDFFTDRASARIDKLSLTDLIPVREVFLECIGFIEKWTHDKGLEEIYVRECIDAGDRLRMYREYGFEEEFFRMKKDLK